MANFLVTTYTMVGVSALLFHCYFKSAGRNNLFTLILVGIICGSLFNSISGFLSMVIDPTSLLRCRRQCLPALIM